MDAYGTKRRWTRDPLAGKFREAILAHRAVLDRHLDQSTAALAVAASILDDLP